MSHKKNGLAIIEYADNHHAVSYLLHYCKKQTPWEAAITIYDQCYNALVITVAISGTSERKTLSGTSLRISSTTRLLKGQFPDYLLKILPSDT